MADPRDDLEPFNSSIDPGFSIELGRGREGFLVHLIVHGLRIGLKTGKAFLEHFPPRDIMWALESRPMERSRILVATTQVNEKVALKQSAGAAGEMLEIALAEGVTTPNAVLEHFLPDDRVRYLDCSKLWEYECASSFWNVAATSKEARQVKRHIDFMLECAIEHRLIDHDAVVAALTIDEIYKRLKDEHRLAIIKASLEAKDKFSACDLLRVTPPSVLVEHIPLPIIWDRIVETLIADALKLKPEPSLIPPTDENAGGTEGPKGPEAPAPTSVGTTGAVQPPVAEVRVVEAPPPQSVRSQVPATSDEWPTSPPPPAGTETQRAPAGPSVPPQSPMPSAIIEDMIPSRASLPGDSRPPVSGPAIITGKADELDDLLDGLEIVPTEELGGPPDGDARHQPQGSADEEDDKTGIIERPTSAMFPDQGAQPKAPRASDSQIVLERGVILSDLRKLDLELKADDSPHEVVKAAHTMVTTGSWVADANLLKQAILLLLYTLDPNEYVPVKENLEALEVEGLCGMFLTELNRNRRFDKIARQLRTSFPKPGKRPPPLPRQK